MKSINLQDKVVVVTGASGGMGAAMTREFARAGARVVLAARSQPVIEQLATELGGPGRALALPTDVADASSVEKMVEQTLSAFGRIDILVNNAGVGYFSPLRQVKLDRVRHVFDVNVIGLGRQSGCRAAHASQGDGHIINVLTCAGRIPIPFQGIYGASKPP